VEGSVDERVDQAVGHSKEEDGVLQIVAQLQAMRKIQINFPIQTLFCGVPFMFEWCYCGRFAVGLSPSLPVACCQDTLRSKVPFLEQLE